MADLVAEEMYRRKVALLKRALEWADMEDTRAEATSSKDQTVPAVRRTEQTGR